MKAGWLRFATLAPVVLYVQARLLGGPLALTPFVVMAGVGAALPLVALLPQVHRSVLFLLTTAFASIALVGYGWAGSPGEMVVGLVLGSPALLIGWLWVSRNSLVASTINFPLSLTLGLFDLAVLRGLPPTLPGLTLPAAVWRADIGSVLQGEWAALTQGTENGQAIVAPMLLAADGPFDLLALIALTGALLSMLMLSERAVRLPVSGGDLAESRRIRSSRSDRRNRFRPPLPAPLRSSAIPESAYLLSGVTALVVTAGVESLFGAATYVGYGAAMIGLGVGVVATLLGLAWSANRRSERPNGIDRGSTGEARARRGLVVGEARPTRIWGARPAPAGVVLPGGPPRSVVQRRSDSTVRWRPPPHTR
jgi:hypothetical protein